MKAQQRHQLKQNDFAVTVERVSAFAAGNRDRLIISGVVVAIAAVAVGGYFFWRKSVNDQAGYLFGVAMAITEAPIAPASTVPGVAQTSGTYVTEAARAEAALAAFQQVFGAYPSTAQGVAARYQAATELLTLNRFPEAEQAFQNAATADASSLYAPLSRLGLAETLAAEQQYDKAIQTLNDLAAARDSALPVDGILMQLARVDLKAGRAQDARVAYKRVVDEFPESVYAATARTELAQLN